MRNSRGFIGVGTLIAILLGLVVVGGGAYYVMRQNAAPSPSMAMPETAPTPSATSSAPMAPASYQTYTNSRYGFSIQYPNAAAPVTGESRMTTQSFFGPTFVSGFTPVVQFQMRSEGSSSNPLEGDLQVSVATSSSLVAACAKLPTSSSSVSGGMAAMHTTMDMGTVNIAGASFHQFDGANSATSNVIGFRSFSAARNGVCYRIEIVVQGSGVDVRPNVSQSTAASDAAHWGYPFSAYDIYSHFTAAAKSFKFTQ